MLNRNQVIQNSELSTSQDKKLNKKNRVDINILLNRVRLDKKRTFKGAASIGSRPTYGDYEPNIEVFIFDFDENLYGENVSISLVKFIRPELKFNSEKELILQMKSDCEIIESVLADD